MLVSCSCVLVSVLAVMVRSLGMLLGRFVIAHLMVMGSLQVVVGSGRMVGGGLMMVLGRGVFAGCCHRSHLLRGHWVRGQ
jgi:hypothetical protein